MATRRYLLGGSMAAFAGALTASGASATIISVSPDAELLSFRAKLDAAVAAIGYDGTEPAMEDEELTRLSERLVDVCWDIANAPRAQTPAGLAIKAAGAMQQFRMSYGGGSWGAEGEEMAWLLLAELAGDVYVPPLMPAELRADEEPSWEG